MLLLFSKLKNHFGDNNIIFIIMITCLFFLQVTNTTGGAECYRKRVESQLAPCLAYFAVAAGKDSLWKPLNQQLLVKSRHSESQVNMCMWIIRSVFGELGGDLLPYFCWMFVPVQSQTIPTQAYKSSSPPPFLVCRNGYFAPL